MPEGGVFAATEGGAGDLEISLLGGARGTVIDVFMSLWTRFINRGLIVETNDKIQLSVIVMFFHKGVGIFQLVKHTVSTIVKIQKRGEIVKLTCTNSSRRIVRGVHSLQRLPFESQAVGCVSSLLWLKLGGRLSATVQMPVEVLIRVWLPTP